MIKNIAFTMYPVTNIARARKFYEQDLGLRVARVFQEAWIEYDIGGGTFAITTLAEGVSPSAESGGGIGFEVDDVDAMVTTLRATGTTVKLEPFSTPICRMAVVLDSEGNALTLHQATQNW